MTDLKAVPTPSRSFAEVASALEKALTEIKAKKDTFDKATKAVQEASDQYQMSVANAQYLRDEMEKTLNDSFGSSQSGRVRVSG